MKIIPLPLFALFLLSGCGALERVDTQKIENNFWQNSELIEAQGEVAKAALEYLGEKKNDNEVVAAPLSMVEKQVESPVEGKKNVVVEKKKEPSCDIVCRFCWDGCQEKCPDYYDEHFSGSGDCSAAEVQVGWSFDGQEWICDPLENGLCPGAHEEDGDLLEDSVAGDEGDGDDESGEPPSSVTDIAIPPGGQKSTANPVGNGNVAVQSSPGATVNYNAGPSSPGEQAEAKLLDAIAGFINRSPVDTGKLSLDKAVEFVPSFAKTVGSTAVQMTGLSMLGNFASDAVNNAGSRYETIGDFGSVGHDESSESHITNVEPEPVIEELLE